MTAPEMTPAACREARERARLSVETLALAAQTRVELLRSYEAGRYAFGAFTLRRLARALGRASQ